MKANTIMRWCMFTLAFFAAFNEARGQYITLMYGAECVGESSLFVLNCNNCSNIYWHVSSPAVVEDGQGTTSARIKWTSPATNASVYVTYSMASYPYSGNAYSDLYNITYPKTPSVSLALNSTTVCKGNGIQFTATPTNAGTSRYYTWYVNGTQVQGGSSATFNYSTASLSPGSHSVYVLLSTSGGCLSSTTATSTSQTFQVLALKSFSVDVQPTSVICADNTNGKTFYADVTGDPVGGLTYQWFKDNSPIGSNSMYLTTDVGSGTLIKCTVTSGEACVSPAAVSNTYTVTPLPMVTPTASVSTTPVAGYCPGESVTFTASSPHSSSSSTYTWYLDGTPVGSNYQLTLTTSATAESGKYYPGCTLTVTVGGLVGQCLASNSASESAPAVTVKPVPTAGAPVPAPICSGEIVAIALSNPNNVPGTTFSWTAVASGVTGSANGSGSSINQTLSTTGSSNGSVTYTITPAANGCFGPSITRTVTVKSIPTVAVSPSLQSICSGEATSIDITNPNAVSGTAFSWTVSAANISGAFNGSGSSVQQVLTQTTNTNKTATYSVVATANSCSSQPVNAVVTVRPKPTVQVMPALSQLCTQESTAITISNPNGVSGTTFSWTVSAPSISGASAGSGNAIAQTLTQTSNSNMTATYTVSATATACSSVTTATVTVKPKPDVYAAEAHLLFSGNSTSIALSTPKAVAGTVFNWTASANNVSGTSNGSGSSINQMLTTSGGGSVTYTVTPVANLCDGTSISTLVTVFPRPIIMASNDRVVMGPVTLSVNDPYESYSWKKAGDVIGSGQSITVNSAGIYTVTVSKLGVSGTSVEFNLADQLDGVNENYIMTDRLMIPITDPEAINSLTVAERNQMIQYFDGLGRLKQTVSTQGSPQGKDVVQPIHYDDFGREAIKYLPYTSNSSEGHFVSDAENAQSAFYDPLQPSSDIAYDGAPFAVTKFESSPLNRVLKQGAPGADWQPGTNPETDRSIKTSYGANMAHEILLFEFDQNTGLINVDPLAKHYLANQLFASATLDEHNNEMIEYTNKEGRIVCKKVQYGEDGQEKFYAVTYYIYDHFGNLVIVLPPEASEKILSVLEN